MSNKVLWITIALVLLAGVTWAAYPGIKKSLDKNAGTGGTGSTGSNTGSNTGSTGTGGGNTSSGGLNMNKVLKNGVYNSAEVSALQAMLNKVQPSNQIAVDGDFGTKTEAKLYSLTGFKQITLAQASQLFAAYNTGTGISGNSSSSSSFWDNLFNWG